MRVVQNRLDLSRTSIFPRLNSTTAPAPGSSGLDFMLFSESVMGSHSKEAVAHGTCTIESVAKTIRNERPFQLMLGFLHKCSNTAFHRNDRARIPIAQNAASVMACLRVANIYSLTRIDVKSNIVNEGVSRPF